MMRKSHIMGTVAQDYLDQMDTVKIHISKRKPKDVPSFDVEKTVKTAGHQIDQMIQACHFPDGVHCSKTKDFKMATTLSYMYGLSYTFNGNSSAPEKRVEVGRSKGLKLHLNCEPHEYYGPFSYDSTGFKVAIHEPGTVHNIDNEGYDASPGFLTSIRIRRAKLISKSYPYPSNCGSRKLENFGRYSQSSCFIECKSKLITQNCKCRYLGMVTKGISVTRFCNSTETNSCISDTLKTSHEHCALDCPLECESIKYNVKTSIAYYPSEHSWELLQLEESNKLHNTSDPRELERSQANWRKSHAAITIFYETTSTDVTEEKPTYDMNDLGSDIGGNMGLFLGCSLLTICEFIDLIIMVCLKRRRKRSTKPADIIVRTENTD